jgi:hypothetical protein
VSSPFAYPLPSCFRWISRTQREAHANNLNGSSRGGWKIVQCILFLLRCPTAPNTQLWMHTPCNRILSLQAREAILFVNDILFTLYFYNQDVYQPWCRHQRTLVPLHMTCSQFSFVRVVLLPLVFSDCTPSTISEVIIHRVRSTAAEEYKLQLQYMCGSA